MHKGKKIKMIRALKGLTQEQLALKINKTRSMVSNIEQTGKVNHYTLLSILNALSITENDFDKFDGKKVTLDSGNSELKTTKKELERALREIDTLNELVKSQKKVIQMLERRGKRKF